MFLALTASLTTTSFFIRQNGFKPNLLYAHNQYAALSGFFLSRLWRIKNVTRLYGTFLSDLMKKPFVSFRYPTATAGFLVPSDLLICANDGTRGDEVAQKFGIPSQRFRFWQNGVDPPSNPPQTTRRDIVERFPDLNISYPWLVSCSRLSYWKRIDRMLKALKVCKAYGVDFQLIVAGDGPEKDNLYNLAQELGVSDRVVWLGAVAHDDIWALMNCADIFLLTNDVTNRCNPLYEAAWAGLPVVSVYDPSTGDLLQHRRNALLSEKDDSETLGKNIVEICQDKHLRRTLGTAQKELSRTFWTWEERMRIEVLELEKLISQSRFKTGKATNVS
jgi:glycosyltransferase involved in cell wall biosynthesis